MMGEGEGGGDLGDYFTASGGLGGFEGYFLTDLAVLFKNAMVALLINVICNITRKLRVAAAHCRAPLDLLGHCINIYW